MLLLVALWLGMAATVLTGAGLLLVLSMLLLYRSVSEPRVRVELSFDQALDLSTISPAERKKEVLLRGLRDIEVERSLGKLSEADYLELAGRYREQALQIMGELDEHERSLRAQIDEMLHQRGQDLGSAEQGEDAGAERAPAVSEAQSAEAGRPS
jgi:hypothetical protein